MAALLPEPADDAREARRQVYQFFSDFRYSLFQDIPSHSDPLIHFLTESRAGHCEYFASTAVLALRQLGVPARYAVGYSVQEYDSTIDMYVVRSRHAHAWAIAWIDDRWQVVDTTPAIWLEAESEQTGPLQPIFDFASNSLFLTQLWWNDQRIEDYETHLYVIGGILVLILIWRIATSDQVRVGRNDDDDNETDSARPGLDSPFFSVEERLAADGYSRAPGEPFERWVRRIGHDELTAMIVLHNHLRFDPYGGSREIREKLGLAVDEWLARRDQSRVSSA